MRHSTTVLVALLCTPVLTSCRRTADIKLSLGEIRNNVYTNYKSGLSARVPKGYVGSLLRDGDQLAIRDERGVQATFAVDDQQSTPQERDRFVSPDTLRGKLGGDGMRQPNASTPSGPLEFELPIGRGKQGSIHFANQTDPAKFGEDFAGEVIICDGHAAGMFTYYAQNKADVELMRGWMESFKQAKQDRADADPRPGLT